MSTETDEEHIAKVEDEGEYSKNGCGT